MNIVASQADIFKRSLLLPPFFTPATLFIYASTAINETMAAVPFPSIGLSTEAHRYTYSPPVRRGTRQNIDDHSRIFAGPRTQLSLLSTATSSLGVILPADLPYNNSAYSVSFSGPIVRCQEAEATSQAQINDHLRESMSGVWGSAKENDSAYFAFVPTRNASNGLTAVWHPRQQTPSTPLNELWLTFMRPKINDSGERIKERHFQVCLPYDASYDIRISQYHGVQNVTANYTIGDAIPYPADALGYPSNLTQHAYSAFMWVLCDQLVGKMAWYAEPNETASHTTPSVQGASQFGVIESPISRTSLLGSFDLDAFFEFDEEKGLYEDQNVSRIFNFSDQRLKDKGLAKNRTLDVLIEELSFNTTISLMHNALLT